MALTTGPHVGPWTEEDLVALPEDAQRYELLEGALLVNPPPSPAHQRISYKLVGYWRVEIDPGPAIFAYRLEQGRFTEAGSADPGQLLSVTEPFPITIDPGDLRP